MTQEQLRALLTRKFGKDVSTHYDAVQLQEAILKEAGKRISTQTIKRLFGLINSSSKQDPATLDAVASYLNFSSYNDLMKWSSYSTSQEQETEHDWTSEIVLHILKDIYPENLQEQGAIQLVKNLFTLFERHPSLTSTLYPKLAQSEFGRRYFFQQFVHYDALAAHYGMGMEHFLLHETKREPRAFAYCILCLKNYLNGNDDGVRYYHEKLGEYTLREINRFHPFVIGRYHAAQVFYQQVQGIDSSAYIDEQVRHMFQAERKAKDNYAGFPCCELVFAEGLVYTRHFRQAAHLLSGKRVKDFDLPSYMDQSFKNHIAILKLFSGVFGGELNPTQAAQALERISNAPVYFLCTTYSAMFLYLVKWKLGLQPKRSEKKAKEAIRQLGYNRLMYFLQEAN